MPAPHEPSPLGMMGPPPVPTTNTSSTHSNEEDLAKKYKSLKRAFLEKEQEATSFKTELLRSSQANVRIIEEKRLLYERIAELQNALTGHTVQPNLLPKALVSERSRAAFTTNLQQAQKDIQGEDVNMDPVFLSRQPRPAPNAMAVDEQENMNIHVRPREDDLPTPSAKRRKTKQKGKDKETRDKDLGPPLAFTPLRATSGSSRHGQAPPEHQPQTLVSSTGTRIRIKPPVQPPEQTGPPLTMQPLPSHSPIQETHPPDYPVHAPSQSHRHSSGSSKRQSTIRMDDLPPTLPPPDYQRRPSHDMGHPALKFGHSPPDILPAKDQYDAPPPGYQMFISQRGPTPEYWFVRNDRTPPKDFQSLVFGNGSGPLPPPEVYHRRGSIPTLETGPSPSMSHEMLSASTSALTGGRTYEASPRHAKPKRLKAHTVKSGTFPIPWIPRDQFGQPRLPLKVGVMEIRELGTICMREHFHTERYIFPVGYEVSRRYASTLDPNKEIDYICTIIEGESGPLFQIASEESQRPVVAGTSTGAWSVIVRAANNIRNRSHSNSVSGPDFFGFGQNIIKHLIQQLPNANKLQHYIWQNFVEGATVGGRHASVMEVGVDNGTSAYDGPVPVPVSRTAHPDDDPDPRWRRDHPEYMEQEDWRRERERERERERDRELDRHERDRAGQMLPPLHARDAHDFVRRDDRDRDRELREDPYASSHHYDRDRELRERERDRERRRASRADEQFEYEADKREQERSRREWEHRMARSPTYTREREREREPVPRERYDTLPGPTLPSPLHRHAERERHVERERERERDREFDRPPNVPAGLATLMN